MRPAVETTNGDLCIEALRRLAPHRLCAFASPRYLAVRGTPMHPNELEGRDTVNLRYQSRGQAFHWPFQIGEREIESCLHPASSLM